MVRQGPSNAIVLKWTGLVKQAFSQRRKMMYKLLKQAWPEEQLSEAFARAGVPTSARAETVSLEQFVELTRILLREPQKI